MSRKYSSSWSYTANYDVQIARPLDNRLVLESTLDLISKNTFGENAKFAYEGMIVAVVNDAVYYLKNLSTLQSFINGDNITTVDYNTLSTAGWERLEGKATTEAEVISLSTEFYNTLNTTSSNLQSNINNVRNELDETIKQLKSDLTNAYVYKGTKATYDDLPVEGNVTGDVWNVEAAYGDVPAGTNYAWSGGDWDSISGIVDLKPLENKTSLVVGVYKINKDSISVSNLNNISIKCIDIVGNHTEFYQVQSEEYYKEVIAGEGDAFDLILNDNSVLTVSGINDGYYQINGF